MSFLKKLGSVFLKITQVLVGFQQSGLIPASAAGAVAVGIRDLEAISAAIVQAEVMGQVLGLPGADKLKAVTPMVAQIVIQSSIVANHKIENTALFEAGCAQIAAGMADVMNSLKGDVKTEDMT
jgi:hypothetical protein